ncbi:MAG: hypothetical protein ACK52I_13960 [Pseudomonadota bacterium]
MARTSISNRPPPPTPLPPPPPPPPPPPSSSSSSSSSTVPQETTKRIRPKKDHKEIGKEQGRKRRERLLKYGEKDDKAGILALMESTMKPIDRSNAQIRESRTVFFSYFFLSNVIFR